MECYKVKLLKRVFINKSRNQVVNKCLMIKDIELVHPLTENMILYFQNGEVFYINCLIQEIDTGLITACSNHEIENYDKDKFEQIMKEHEKNGWTIIKL